MNTNKSVEAPERLGCGHSKRRPSGTIQPAGEPRAAGLERPGNGPRYLVRKDHRGASGGRVMAYKSEIIGCRCVSYANGRVNRWRRSPWLISSLKPYWGKPAVRNFRGGGGNVRHGLAALCHTARKGGYIGSRSTYTGRASSPLDHFQLSRTITTSKTCPTRLTSGK